MNDMTYLFTIIIWYHNNSISKMGCGFVDWMQCSRGYFSRSFTR